MQRSKYSQIGKEKNFSKCNKRFRKHDLSNEVRERIDQDNPLTFERFSKRRPVHKYERRRINVRSAFTDI